MRKSLVIATVSLLALLGCTRKTTTTRLKVNVPIQHKVGGLSGNYYLNAAIANIQIAGRSPIVSKIDMHDSETRLPIGQGVTFDVPNVPNGASVLVQALMVFTGEDQGDMRFYYGDASATISGNMTLSVTAKASAASAGKEARIFGRYLTDFTSGPTGTLTTKYKVGNGKPDMEVEEGSILNGWFEAFAIEGVNFDIVVKDSTGATQTLFNNLTISGGQLEYTVNGSPQSIAYGTHLLNVTKPSSYRREFRGDSVRIRPEPETQMILGFFGDPSFMSGRKVIYPEVQQGVPNVFFDSAATIPVDYMGSSGGATKIRRVAGGESSSLMAVYTHDAPGCTPSSFDSGLCLAFYHNKLENGVHSFSGVRMPFRGIDLLSNRHVYARATFKNDGCSGADCTQLEWKLLPGVDEVVSEIEIWHRFTPSGGGYDGSLDTCEDLTRLGYTKHATTSSSNTTYDFMGVEENNYYMHQFYLCAKAETDGQAKYVGEPVWVDYSCTGGCNNDMDHFGWALSSYSTVVPSDQYNTDFYRVTDVVVAPNYVEAMGVVTGSWADGDEALIHVSAMAEDGDCGSSPEFGPNRVGSYSFTRVLSQQSDRLVLPRGTILDSIDAGYLDAGGLDSNFCVVQIVKVKHYHDLTIETSTKLTTNPFDFMIGGGILPIRVSGTLTMQSGAEISANGKGFAGGIAGYNGAGMDRDTDPSMFSTNGGIKGSTVSGRGGGGGGFGNGGQASTVDDGQGGAGAMFGAGSRRMLFGGGGGGAGSADPGTHGGGIVFVVANQISVTSGAARIAASGDFASGNGGAGGGGSVFIMTKKLIGSSTTLMGEAVGGSASSGGVGGGGSVESLICDATGMFTSNVAMGVTGASTGAQDGWSNILNPTDYKWTCQ